MSQWYVAKRGRRKVPPIIYNKFGFIVLEYDNEVLAYFFKTLETKTIPCCISGHLIEGMIDCLKKIDSRYHILCAGYLENEIQIGITGKVKFKETDKEAANRELSEEVGLTSTALTLKYRSPITSCFVTHIQDCELCYKEEDIHKSDTYLRVGLFVFGEERELIQVVERIKENTNTETTFVGLLSQPEALRMTKKIQRVKKVK